MRRATISLRIAVAALLGLMGAGKGALAAADYQIAFAKGGNPMQVFVMAADGSNQTLVYEGPGSALYPLTWSHDGKSLAFLSPGDGIYRIDGVDQGQVISYATLVVPMSGTCFDGNTPYHHTFIGNPRWSPTKDELAFTAAAADFEVLCVAPASGGGPPEVVTLDLFLGWRLAWNAVGTQIAYIGDDALLKIVDRATGDQVRECPPGIDETWGRPDWARDGDSRIAFQTSGFKNTFVYTVDPETCDFSDPIVSGGHPSWSPDSSQLVFNNPKGQGRVSLYTLATGQVEDLAVGLNPDWRPPAPACNADTDCDDGNSCTEDSCDSGLCTHTPNSDPCDDGNECTYSDTCAGGSCSGLPYADETTCSLGYCCGAECVEPVCLLDDDCDDYDSCTIDTCNFSPCAAQCEYELNPLPACLCTPSGESCETNDQCCSGRCHPVKEVCK